MEDSESSCLLCNEDESSLEEQFEHLGFCSASEFDSEYAELLIQKETTFQPDSEKGSAVKCERTWLKCARVAAVKWVLHTRALFGLHLRTAYLSLIYFDRFLSRRSIDNGKLWAVRLLSVACLSLAAKMEEHNAPALSDYRVDQYNFEGNMIQRMELLVLNTLEWKMSCATPFAYLNYFIIKFCGEFGNDVINRAVELILAVVGEINVVEYRPSIIAASAVLAACDYRLTEKLMEVKINAVPSWGSLEKERTYSCHNLMQEFWMSKSKLPGSIIYRNLSSTHSSSIDNPDDSAITSIVGKKRRLTYIDSNQHCHNLKIPKSY